MHGQVLWHLSYQAFKVMLANTDHMFLQVRCFCFNACSQETEWPSSRPQPQVYAGRVRRRFILGQSWINTALADCLHKLNNLCRTGDRVFFRAEWCFSTRRICCTIQPDNTLNFNAMLSKQHGTQWTSAAGPFQSLTGQQQESSLGSLCCLVWTDWQNLHLMMLSKIRLARMTLYFGSPVQPVLIDWPHPEAVAKCSCCSCACSQPSRCYMLCPASSIPRPPSMPCNS